ncbi:MAG: NAD(P)-dependent oxidoreductase [Acidobacteria bacterium]|nr:NAD(P)-dependent oxidoreductase [Acidobacteriota bacterium]
MKLPASEVEGVVARVARDADALRGASLFVTGGTGFLGRWMVETFCALHDAYALGARMFVATRDAARFREDAPHLAEHPAIALATTPAHCDFVVHGATPSASELATDPRLLVDTLAATREALELAVRCRAKRFLYMSSGAMYGSQPADLALLPETFRGAPDALDPNAAYAESKRAGELLCAAYAKRHGLEIVILRGFSFIGPHLPLTDKFAAGNFLASALAGRAIEIRGDGSPVRSYLATADFAAWFWAILMRGTSGRAYNVGSETPVTIGELAREAAQLADAPLPVTIHGKPQTATPPARYVPSTARAREELGVAETIDWRAALRSTFEWVRAARHEALAAGSVR